MAILLGNWADQVATQRSQTQAVQQARKAKERGRVLLLRVGTRWQSRDVVVMLGVWAGRVLEEKAAEQSVRDKLASKERGKYLMRRVGLKWLLSGKSARSTAQP